ncbi:hypothetical protein A9P82_13230 [Arachidicoccus ginsenosidimutans]|uniref:hypothetical protein n=1 Tax=Arachidicoccus sp. BS20 TaxID=1850526 RepID=UPI0007F12A6D|nr:hypothetical protein [Arachidicoccus sp. BS20]ANI90162.1 hypothetical protein A9P82_13230 [Arachidicoccus sp. BS20]
MFFFFFYILPFILIFFCFWLPYKIGKKNIGIGISSTLLIITLLGLRAEFFFIFIWLFIVAVSIVVITYSALLYFKKPNTARIVTVILLLLILLGILSPWISDWTFTGNDARKMLKERGFVLSDKIKILSNESGGLRDYSHTFSISVSDNDYKKIKNLILSQHNYLGKASFEGYPQHSDSAKNDIITYEDENFYNWDEIYNGYITHYFIQLDKHKNQLSFDEEDN